MNQLCRHILPAGRHCTQPAVHATLYCRHHQVIKRALAQVEPKPDPYGIYKPLPFVFPEDRAALQINFMLVARRSTTEASTSRWPTPSTASSAPAKSI